MSVTSASETGARATQEDRVVAERVRLADRDVWILAVLDGHGGDGAAHACAAALPTLLQESWHDADGSMSEALNLTVGKLAELADKAEGGTALSVAIVDERASAVCAATVGDSPIVVETADGDLWSPSRHHASNREQRQRAIARGAVFQGGYLFNRARDGEADKERGAIILCRALGAGRFPFVDATPDSEMMDVGPRSFVLVGSDGLLVMTARWSEAAFASFVRTQVKVGWTARDFVRDALNVAARDNISAVLWTAPSAVALGSARDATG